MDYFLRREPLTDVSQVPHSMKIFFRFRVVLIGFLTLIGIPAFADSLDETITALMQKRNIPGLSIAIVQDGRIVKARGYGVTEQGGAAQVTDRTLFQAGSISKPVAAFAALRLVDAGKLSLDADVNGGLKTWKVPENQFTATEKVTLRRLLSHSAGINVFHFPGYSVGGERPALTQVLNGEKPSNTDAVRVEFTPGTQSRYSGGGYVVLQQLLIDVTDQAFPTFMSDSVFNPLGMRSSTYEQPLPSSLEDLAATGHYAGAKLVPGRWHVYPEMAAAGLWTTPTDLARFLIGVQEALAGKPGALLKAETARRMLTREIDNFGLGFFLEGTGIGQRFMHDGRDDGFDAQLAAYHATGRGVVIMINANENSSFMKQVLAAVVNAYAWPDFTPFTPPVSIVDGHPQVTATVKKIFDQAQQGKIEAGLFTERLAAKLAGMLASREPVRALQRMGAVNSISLIGKKSDAQTQSYRYRLILENDVVLANCTFDQDGKISVLTFQPE